jgi:hypothetical protein
MIMGLMFKKSGKTMEDIHRVHCAGLSDVHAASHFVVPCGGSALSQDVVDLPSACSLNTRYKIEKERVNTDIIVTIMRG